MWGFHVRVLDASLVDRDACKPHMRWTHGTVRTQVSRDTSVNTCGEIVHCNLRAVIRDSSMIFAMLGSLGISGDGPWGRDSLMRNVWLSRALEGSRPHVVVA